MEMLFIIYMLFSLSILKNTNFLSKQIIWYFFGLLIYYFVKKIKLKYIYNIIFYIYIILNIFLLYLLIFGSKVNGAKIWIDLGFMSFQPSEFMKITLIVMLSLFINKSNKFLILITLIPSILTFLEPDTGNVLFYMLILFTILFLKNKKMLIKPLIVLLVFFSIFIGLYFFNNNMFIDVFGTSFFYRFDRLINLFSNSSFQLNEALKGMGSAHLFGFKNSIYVPASTTDFAFASLIISHGFIIGIIYLFANFIFNYLVIKRIKLLDANKKVIAILTITMKIVQEMIHILMNVGLFPIMGITLPFISYGGSSIISYFIIFAIINNCNNMDY